MYFLLGATIGSPKGDACSAHTVILRLLVRNRLATYTVILRLLVRNRMAASLLSKDEETKHENNEDETLHAD